MRLFAALVAICALSQTAIARTPECQSLSDARARLTCYNKLAPFVATPGTAKPATRTPPASKIDSTRYVDSIGAEDALMNARLKNICRGC